MNRFNQLLGSALAIQIIIACGIYFGSQPPAAEQSQFVLFDVEKDRIDRITIDGGDSEEIVLSNVDGTWKLPDYYQLPAQQNKITDILSTLKNTKRGWPVTNTVSSHERFKVSDKNFQKKVVFSKGDKDIQTLYLGTSPGFRQLHVRREGENEVYAVKLNSYDFPSQYNNWLNKDLLQPGGDIVNLRGKDFAFQKQGDNWQLTEGEGEPVTSEIEKIISTLAHLTVQSAEIKSISEIEYQLTIKAMGDTLKYHFFKEENDHFVSRDDYKLAFKINKSDYEKITGQSAIQLVNRVESEKEGSVMDTHPDSRTQSLSTTDNKQKEVLKENS